LSPQSQTIKNRNDYGGGQRCGRHESPFTCGEPTRSEYVMYRVQDNDCELEG